MVGEPVDRLPSALTVVRTERLRLAEALPVRVGKNCARADCTSACASRYCASATRMFWLAAATCSSSALSCGSPKISHQVPRAMASLGVPTFHSPAVSLYCCGTSAEGRL